MKCCAPSSMDWPDDPRWCSLDAARDRGGATTWASCAAARLGVTGRRAPRRVVSDGARLRPAALEAASVMAAAAPPATPCSSEGRGVLVQDCGLPAAVRLPVWLSCRLVCNGHSSIVGDPGKLGILGSVASCDGERKCPGVGGAARGVDGAAGAGAACWSLAVVD